MEIPYEIKCILKEKKITDFLNSRGIVPARRSGEKLLYHCPLHKGDNEPSFTVYTNNEYENYFCYGCSKGGNIINLLSDIDGIPIRYSVRQLIKDIDIKETDVLNSLVKVLENGIMSDNDMSIEVLAFIINRSCFSFFKDINFDEKELIFFDKVFQIMDNTIKSRDIDSLREMNKMLIPGYILKRLKKYRKRKEVEALIL